jgi:heme exporter protein A
VSSWPLPSAGLHFEDVEKRYGGLYALRRLNLEIRPRETIALAGRNGSGKTTLLRIAAGLVRPTAGQVRIDINETDVETARARVGFVAHQTMVYDELTAEENLTLFARLLGIERRQERVQALLEEVGLGERRASLVRTFSRGMRQRLSLARNLLAQPSLLLLDEPSTGLDPQGVRWLAGTLRRFREDGCTILMSLHGQSELTALASRAVRLEAGIVVADSQAGGSIASVVSFADA